MTTGAEGSARVCPKVNGPDVTRLGNVTRWAHSTPVTGKGTQIVRSGLDSSLVRSIARLEARQLGYMV